MEAFPTDGFYFIYEVIKRYTDSETSRNPLGSWRGQNTSTDISNILKAVSPRLRTNTPVTKESLRMAAGFNIAPTGADLHALYESHKYLLNSTYVPGTI